MGICYIVNLVESDMKRWPNAERISTVDIKDRINSYSHYAVSTEEVLRALKRLEEKGAVRGFNSESGYGYKWELSHDL